MAKLFKVFASVFTFALGLIGFIYFVNEVLANLSASSDVAFFGGLVFTALILASLVTVGYKVLEEL